MSGDPALFPPVVAQALQFAADRHAAQTYGDGQPYAVHLRHVMAVLDRYQPWGNDAYCRALLRVAAPLHDVVEDTDTVVAEVIARFGAPVGRLVWAVTDEPGRNRRERHAATYPKIRRHGREAVCLKLADRIANVEACVSGGDRRLSMYQKEHAAFRAALYAPEEADAMWARLDALLGPLA